MRSTPSAIRSPSRSAFASVAAKTPLARLRELCLSFPESHEIEAWGEPTFRVRNKVFAMYASPETHHGAGRPSVWIKSAHVTQDMLVRAEPARYFVPPYVGKGGWVGAYLDKRPSWRALNDLLWDGYRMAAPKTLLARLDAAAPSISLRTPT